VDLRGHVELGDGFHWQAPAWVVKRLVQKLANDSRVGHLMTRLDPTGSGVDLRGVDEHELSNFAYSLKTLEKTTLDFGPSYFPSVPAFGQFLARLGGLRQIVNFALAARGGDEVDDTIY
jgi:hypothetical protein